MTGAAGPGSARRDMADAGRTRTARRVTARGGAGRDGAGRGGAGRGAETGKGKAREARA